MLKLKATGVFVVVLAAFFLASCGGSTGVAPDPSDQASVFTIGTDAPLQGVVSCLITVTGVTLNNGTTNVSVLSTPQVVDFAQLSGLHQLLDLNSVPTGTYTSATVTLATPVIGFIDTTQTPPAVSTINGTLSQTSVTVNFANPFVLNNADLVGLRMEFDLRQSLATDGSGNVTGAVNPMFHMQLLAADDSNVSIDCFLAGVVGVTNDTTFVVQGPKGRHWTVQTNANTALDDPSDPINSFTTSTIVEVSGQLDPVTHDIDASEVEVVSNDNFFIGGLFTSIRPPSGAATQADVYIRSVLPDINGVQDGQIQTLSLDGSEKYKIANIANPITSLLFNNSALAAGQSVGIGGMLTTSNGVSDAYRSSRRAAATGARRRVGARKHRGSIGERGHFSVERSVDGRNLVAESVDGADRKRNEVHQPEWAFCVDRDAGHSASGGRIYPHESIDQRCGDGGSVGGTSERLTNQRDSPASCER